MSLRQKWMQRVKALNKAQIGIFGISVSFAHFIHYVILRLCSFHHNSANAQFLGLMVKKKKNKFCLFPNIFDVSNVSDTWKIE